MKIVTCEGILHLLSGREKKKKHLSTKNTHKSKPFIALQVWRETAAEYGFHINAARQKTGRQNKLQNSRMSNRSVPALVSLHLCRDGPN